MQEPYYIRRLLTETTVRADDRGRVVGAEAYEAAGGIILRDLFEQDSGGWFQDAALLEQLVFDKLKVDADAIRAEGWKWVEAAISFPYGHTSGMRRSTAPRELSAEEIDARRAQGRIRRLEARHKTAPTNCPTRSTRGSARSRRRSKRFETGRCVFDPAEVALAGAFVSIDVRRRLCASSGAMSGREDEPRGSSADDRARAKRAGDEPDA